MKHTITITILLLAMFFSTQLIGLFIIHSYMPRQVEILKETTSVQQNITIKPKIPYGMEQQQIPSSQVTIISFLFSLSFAILIIILLMKINATIFLRFWYFLVVLIALAISINSFFLYINPYPHYADKIALVLAAILAYYKIFRRDLLVHNITELLIYPGIAVIFVDFLSLTSTIFLLLAISIYDIYAVWYSGFMQQMAKFQINKVKIFSGFFVPYADKKTRQILKRVKHAKKFARKKKEKYKKIKIQLAILGGGDVVFPLIFAGVIMKTLGVLPALIITIFSTFSLAFLFALSKKGKFYPAMPFLTIGCLFGLLLVELWKFLF